MRTLNICSETISKQIDVVATADFATTFDVNPGVDGAEAVSANIGETASTYGYGWGTDTWSAGAWDEPSTASDVTVAARSWSLDNFGEDLIATVLNASTYIKDLSGSIDARATALSNAPK